ncbi:hypothetical protein KBY96_06065 [Cyanobium sp. ATX 6A2]|uniref:hypothetical protein n=1 Tax=Cyanobium sp. ATX 6A2 TaxID=2823700 RepID=UPI0020CF68E1|nr:hypothetical protein [Cyanobium sp. ATX 6A2]MCP9887500.1 hypothetical protein [Cyanobium sp. ATX 6A2]
MVDYFQVLPHGTGVVLGGSQYGDNYFEIRDLQGQLLMNLRIPDDWVEEGNSVPSTSHGDPTLVSADGKLLYLTAIAWVYKWDLPENSP